MSIINIEADVQLIEKFVLETSKNLGTANAWLQLSVGKVYLRKAFHQLGVQRELNKTLDIANICIDEDKRGKGYFTELLDAIYSIACKYNMSLYIENVLDKRFQSFFLKKGFMPAYHDLCFYKFFKL